MQTLTYDEMCDVLDLGFQNCDIRKRWTKKSREDFKIVHAGIPVLKEFFEKALKQKSSGGVPLSCGSELALFLASPASDGITGKLISAVWDNWKDWPEHIDELCNSDTYTLRRIVGRERGFDWGDV